MLTYVFSAEDVARIRLAISPFGHLLHGVGAHGAASRVTRARERWWHDVRRLVPERARPLIELINALPGYTPCFLVPEMPTDGALGVRCLTDELQALVAVPEDRVQSGLAPYKRMPRPPRIVNDLRNQTGRALCSLADAAQILYSACMADEWPDICHQAEADVAYRTHLMATRGAAQMLDTLHPLTSWRAGCLRICTGGPTRDVELGGRGLVLLPDVFLADGTVDNLDFPELLAQPSLTYTVHAGLVTTHKRRSDDGLAALVGHAHARALRALGTGCSTGELARRLGVGPPTASHHAARLRGAGLVSTERNGRGVAHSLTELGARLLSANPESSSGGFRSRKRPRSTSTGNRIAGAPRLPTGSMGIGEPDLSTRGIVADTTA